LELKVPNENEEITNKVKLGLRDAIGISNNKIVFFKIYKSNKDDQFQIGKFRWELGKELLPNLLEAVEYFEEILDEKNKSKRKKTKK
jgi:hypothetical protein